MLSYDLHFFAAMQKVSSLVQKQALCLPRSHVAGLPECMRAEIFAVSRAGLTMCNIYCVHVWEKYQLIVLNGERQPNVLICFHVEMYLVSMYVDTVWAACQIPPDCHLKTQLMSSN